MIGWILCRIGLHEWWGRSDWPESLFDVMVRHRVDLEGCIAVCGRCPAKRWR